MSKTVKRLIVAAAFSGCGFLITFAWYKFTDPGKTAGVAGREIARLVTSVNDVQRKPKKKLIWNPVEDNEKLYVGDTIRTASNAEARIEFLKNGAAIMLDPDSAIVLEEQGDEIALNFLKGNIVVRGGSGGAAGADGASSGGGSGLVLKTGEKTVNLAGADLSLGKSGSGEIDLQVLKGTLSGDLGKLASQGIKIVSPLPGQPIYLNTAQNEQAEFAWEKLPAGYEVILEAGNTREDMTPVPGGVAPGENGQLKTPFKIGKSFFRLVARSTDPAKPELKSSPLRVQVLAKIPPVLLEPSADEKVLVSQSAPEIKLLWSNPAGFAKVIVEIAKTPDLKDKVKTEYLENTSEYTFTPSDSTTYYWRVSGTLEGKNEVVSSKVQSFVANVQKELLPPELERPLANERLPVEAIKEKGLFVSWKPALGATRYKVTVERTKGDERNPSSRDVVFEDESNLLQSQIGKLEPGTYVWTVASVDSKNATSKPADKRIFVVQKLQNLKWADGKDKEDYFYITLRPSLLLKWEKGIESAVKWRVKVWDPDQPDKVVERTIEQTSTEFEELPKDGKYEALVEALDGRDNVVARSNTREIRVMSSPLLPAPEFAAELPDEILASQSGSAKIAWQSVNGAKEYVLQLKSPDGKVAQYKYTANDGVISDLMPGQYKVQLKSIDLNGREGPAGEERVLKVPSTSGVKAPKLKGMKVK